MGDSFPSKKVERKGLNPSHRMSRDGRRGEGRPDGWKALGIGYEAESLDESQFEGFRVALAGRRARSPREAFYGLSSGEGESVRAYG
jgi:hypothetical protein